MLRAGLMSASKATRRLSLLVNSIKQPVLRPLCSDGRVSIGDVSIALKKPLHPELVPIKYYSENLPQTTLNTLRWIIQKDKLGQDVFLIGPPGPLRRLLAMQYLELTNSEMEYLALTRDTTESDLKQRREIHSGTAFYVDQCAVRAAVDGRILVLEGIEKAERNVLPVLNNLLENREMQLEDGRFLMSASRYDTLLKEHTKEEMDSWNLVRVSEDFRVIALGLPVPQYHGNPLDPPLRSRFQARDIQLLPYKDKLSALEAATPDLPQAKLVQLVSFAQTLQSSELLSIGLPDFPVHNLIKIVKILEKEPQYSLQDLVYMLYPYDLMLSVEGQKVVQDAIKTFQLEEKYSTKEQIEVEVVKKQANDISYPVATVHLKKNNHSFTTMNVPCGIKANDIQEHQENIEVDFVMTPYHSNLLSTMLRSHSVHDFCLIGPKGCGKTVIVQQFAKMLGYRIEPVVLYQDMTSRDLLQQRITLADGDTNWRPSPLVIAALEGHIAELDGLHRVNPGTLAVLHRLVHDRELQLYDGTRLVRQDRYQALKEKLSLTDEEMSKRGINSIHPSFRIIGLAEPPVIGSSQPQWLNSEVLSMFLFHKVSLLSRNEEADVIYKMVPGVPRDPMEKLLNLTDQLRNAKDLTVSSVSSSLSTRQLLRIAHRLASYPAESLEHSINKACLSRFLPKLAAASLEKEMQEAKIPQENSNGDIINEYTKTPITSELQNGNLRIGQTTIPVHNPENKTKVPDVLFYDIPQHLSIMEDMLKDFALGEHLLLVGNQGVGKNKIVDRFLHLLNRPREYIQLHRDTTVQSLTLQPTVQDGVIVYEDSPLVRAVKHGHVLVVDEADKAPTHVTCILKSLVESGVMVLGDGRRIIKGHSVKEIAQQLCISDRPVERIVCKYRASVDVKPRKIGRLVDSVAFTDNEQLVLIEAILENPDKGDDGLSLPDNVIKGHSDFRMIVLANRPGFPFLGNDFFAALGDIFSSHAVNNPDFKSEMAMLRQYGPSVPEDILVKLVNAFGELRSRADQGLISYPYSTREVVSVVKHLQAFSDEGVASVVRNVFDFDSYHPEVRDVVVEVMHKHGIPMGTSTTSIHLVKEIPLSGPVFLANWLIADGGPGSGEAINCPVEERRLKIKGPIVLDTSKKDLDKTIDRSKIFTEQLSHWNLPLHEGSFVNSVATGPGDIRGDWIHTLALNPVTLFSCQTSQHTVTVTDLYQLFPRAYLSILPRLQMAALGQELTGQVLLFDQQSNILMQLDSNNSSIRFLSFQSLAQNTKRKLTRHFSVQQNNEFKMCSAFSHENWVAIYQEGSNKMDIVDIVGDVTQHITFPFVIGQFHPFSRDLWLLEETGTDRKFLVSKPYPEAPVPCVLYPVTSDTVDDAHESHWQTISTRSLPSNILCSVLGDDKRSRSNRLLTNRSNYATIALAQPDQLVVKSPVSLYTFPRNTSTQTANNPKESYTRKKLSFDSIPPVSFPATGQVIRLVPKTSVPEEAKNTSEQQTDGRNLRNPTLQTTGYLEVVDVGRRSLRYLPLLGSSVISLYTRLAEAPVFMAPTSDDSLVTIDVIGQVRMWETGFKNLENSLDEWKKLIGKEPHGNLQVNYSRDSGLDVTAPKHGKIDPSNDPHVGGNTWAGGSGGRDTAGLGGKGGPYRLDAGHDVHQIPDQEKDQVPDEVKQAAREMARKAFKERLREIQMSEYDAEMYEAFSSRVRRQVQSLRVILDGLQAKSRERVWLRHQTSGELDDTKLIEGLTGERSIYKKRGEEEPELGTPQRLPKRLRFVVDVSGSMYRFNGLDGRLDRMMEAACLVMEALFQYDDKIKYDIVGHSGESPEIIFVSDDSLPKNNRERLDIMKEIHAHAQYCMSGDYTLEATSLAIKRVSAFDADEHFVVVLSDANLERYGIAAKDFGKVLTSDPKVNAFAVFIGSLGNQADRLVKTLPTGHAFVCLDTKQLPLVLQQIFTSTLLSSK